MSRITTPIILLLFALALSAGNCPGSGGDDDSSDPSDVSETPPQSALSVEFDDLSFTHTFNVSPCPQLIGTIRLTNSTDAEANYSMTDSGALVSFSPGPAGTIPPGETVTVEVQFNCGDCPGAAGYSSTVTVDVGNGSKTNTQTAQVTGSFVDCP